MLTVLIMSNPPNIYSQEPSPVRHMEPLHAPARHNPRKISHMYPCVGLHSLAIGILHDDDDDDGIPRANSVAGLSALVSLHPLTTVHLDETRKHWYSENVIWNQR